MRKRLPESLHCPVGVDRESEGRGCSHSHLAESWCPYSLLRQVLHLQVVHLQLSPQMQIPPRREGRDWVNTRLLILGRGVGQEGDPSAVDGPVVLETGHG